MLPANALDFIEALKADHVVRAVYCNGSYAGSYAISRVSDVDLLCVIEEGAYPKIEREHIRELAQEYSSNLCELDVLALSMKEIDNCANSSLVREMVLSAKLCGFLLSGDDVLSQWNLPNITDYQASTRDMTIEFIKRVRKNEGWANPLEYPNGSDKYRGYVEYDRVGGETKLLISIYTWIATSVLADQGIYCGSKNQCVDDFNKMNKGEYSNQLNHVYNSCRNEWHYGIPEHEEGKRMLSSFCDMLLAYENRFIFAYPQDGCF